MTDRCPRCQNTQFRWQTVRQGVPLDVLQCTKCNAVLAKEDWVAPTAPLQAGRCVNCGDRRGDDGLCMNCGLSKAEDVQVHDELRAHVNPDADLLDAARDAVRQGRRLIGLKLATAGAMWLDDDAKADTARAMRVWLLSAIGEAEMALADAKVWVESSPKPTAMAWASLGQQYLTAGVTGAAANAFSEAVEIDPKNHSARAQRASLLMGLRREGQALDDVCKLFGEALDERSMAMVVQTADKLADLFEGQKRDDEVGRLIEYAGTHTKRSAVLLAHRARLAALQGDKNQAKADLMAARELVPEMELYDRVLEAIKPAGSKSSWFRWG